MEDQGSLVWTCVSSFQRQIRLHLRNVQSNPLFFHKGVLWSHVGLGWLNSSGGLIPFFFLSQRRGGKRAKKKKKGKQTKQNKCVDLTINQLMRNFSFYFQCICRQTICRAQQEINIFHDINIVTDGEFKLLLIIYL